MEKLLAISTSLLVCLLSVSMVTCRTYNDPVYPVEYIGEKCVSFPNEHTNDPDEWNERVVNMTEPGSKLYGYVRVKENGAPYDNPCNCAVKLLAPPGYKIVMRIPRIEIYHENQGCNNNKMSLIGDSEDILEFCGFGTVAYSILATDEWVIVRLKSTEWEWDTEHDYIGFSLYYTAIHNAPCNQNPNVSEFACNNHCIPELLTCDDRDNCGDWDDEDCSVCGVCGLSEGAIIAISIVSVLVGGGLLFLLIYCMCRKHKNKRTELAMGQAGGTSTTTQGTSTVATMTDPVTASAEPPRLHTPEAYLNMGLYTGDEGTNPGQNGTAATNTQTTGPEAITVIRL